MTGMLHGWFHLARGAVVGRALGFVSNLLLSRLLGPSELGLFNLVTTTVQTSDTLVRCGGDYSLNFELGGKPEFIQTERGDELARGFVQLCTITTTLICVLVAIWICLCQGLFPNSLLANQRLLMTILLLLMIACEGISASAWEILLVSHRINQLALRQGIFFPLRLLFAAAGAHFGGLVGAMAGWTLIALVQCTWLRGVLVDSWIPFRIWPLLVSSLRQLLKRGLPFYAVNLLASVIFYPLLLKVASATGLSEIGYLRVGQILQQLFAFLPATLVPVLFLKLRGQSGFADQAVVIERPLRMIWLLLLEALLLYCLVDKPIMYWLFGPGFVSSLLPTRLLLITALAECLTQLIVQPVLAAGKIRLYGFCQNGVAVFAAILGWLWIPSAGLAAYLIVKLLYVLVPLVAIGIPVFQRFHEPHKLLLLALATMALLTLSLSQILIGFELDWLSPFLVIIFMVIGVFHFQDFLVFRQMLSRTA